ncbi:hypothetical protein EV193_104557 [Herbihabitans rhizosphaerae]|uniref:Excreted virulence factor EspC (Type VII ESX diderm) n=1 Tax=Herbihabitans rhizosphaerae TaxID=1872711 RepID=A0A4Q7KT65_9PSEU|nr:DUF6507 family protein [Herbihabitans rhizosphaerae]RZS39340.1 hypothetical protein EV193_104557 [Herbihabitans rhizosphaerae]
MPDDGFFVDIEALDKLIGSLSKAEQSLKAANDKLSKASSNDLGHAEIDRAGEKFQDRWEHGIKKIAEFTGKSVEGLNGARKTYDEVNQRNRDRMNRIADTLPGGPR